MYCDYLVEFVAVARNRSLSRAATELSVSQSSLSRHMRALETHLGIRLLTRQKDGVDLTDSGHYVYNRAGDIVDAMEDIDFYASQHLDADNVVVGGMSIYPSLVQEFIKRCAAIDPHVHVRQTPPGDFDEEGIKRTLDQRSLDVYVTLSTDKRLMRLGKGYRAVRCMKTPVVVVMEPTNPLVKEIPLTVPDLDGQTLLHAQSDFDGEIVNWEDTKHSLRRFGIDYRSKTCTLESKTDMLVDQRAEVFLLPEAYTAVDMLRSAGKMVTEVQGISKDVVCVYRADAQNAALLDKMLDGMDLVFRHADSVVSD